MRVGLRANATQFSLLVGLNLLVGAIVGLERSVLPLVGKDDFHVRSSAAVLAFVVAFGAAKSLTNLVAGALADRAGRKRLLVLGWLLALPVPVLIALAPNWWVIVAANLLLGANQGLAWSMTVVMKIDLAGPARRGLALGLNESAGYLGVALTAFASGALVGTIAPRTVVWTGALAIALAGLVVSTIFVRDTGEHVTHEQQRHGVREAVPLGAAHGRSSAQIGAVAAVYPGVWGFLQVATGWVSDHAGRKPLIALGMLVQAAGLAMLVGGGGAFAPSLAAATLLGVGTALVYPTLIAAVSDVAQPRDRASLVGVYRFWRDAGFVAGALLAGLTADAFGPEEAIATVAALTALSGFVVAATPWRTSSAPMGGIAAFPLADGPQPPTL